GYGSGVKVWIDYDHNGIFDPYELVTASASTISAGSVHTGTFTIPLTAMTGYTRMRVRAVESTTIFDPCSSHTWGEAEDYLVNIVPATPCSDPSIEFPTTAVADASPTMV